MRQAVIFGARGGIGQALCEALALRGDFDRIWAGSRQGVAVPGTTSFACDITDEANIAQVAATVAAQGPVHLVIVASGILHDGAIQPEKSWRSLDPVAMARVYAVNTIGPALIGKHFLPLLPRDQRAVFTALSARVSSISDNHLGGWHSYRASKTALNMVVANFALELARSRPQAIAATLHPGTVDSDLSTPFKKTVAEGHLFSPATSAGHLLRVIDGLTPADNGKLIAWDGETVPF